MKRIIAVAIYMALALGAIPSHADTAAAALRTGDMKKLLFHSAPKPVPTVLFDLADGAGTRSLQDYEGKYVLLNFWPRGAHLAAMKCPCCQRCKRSLAATSSKL